MAAPFSIDSADIFTRCPLAVLKPEKAFGGAVVSLFCWMELSLWRAMAVPFSIESSDSFTLWPLAVWKPEKAFGGVVISLFCWMDSSIWCTMAAPFSIDSSDSFTLWPLAVWKPEKEFAGAVVSLFCWRELLICCIMAAPFSVDSADSFISWPLAVWRPEEACGGAVASLFCWRELSICCIMTAPLSIDSADSFTSWPLAVWKPEKAVGGAMRSPLCIFVQSSVVSFETEIDLSIANSGRISFKTFPLHSKEYFSLQCLCLTSQELLTALFVLSSRSSTLSLSPLIAIKESRLLRLKSFNKSSSNESLTFSKCLLTESPTTYAGLCKVRSLFSVSPARIVEKFFFEWSFRSTFSRFSSISKNAAEAKSGSSFPLTGASVTELENEAILWGSVQHFSWRRGSSLFAFFKRGISSLLPKS